MEVFNNRTKNSDPAEGNSPYNAPQLREALQNELQQLYETVGKL